MSLIFVGDLGGTNIRYKLILCSPGDEKEISSAKYSTDQYKTDILRSMKEFLNGHDTPHIAVFGICGVVQNNKIMMSITYGPGLCSEMITEATGIPKVYILNDLESSGYGINMEGKSNGFVEINGGTPTPNGPIVCCSIGTGIGICYQIHDGNRYQVIPSEGGFQAFSPNSDIEYELYKFKRKEKNRNYCSYSSIVSGSNIHSLYDFVKTQHKDKINPEFDKEYVGSTSFKANKLMTAGFSGSDEISVIAADLWQRVIGNFLGNVFGIFLPIGGIYLFGGPICKNHQDLIERKIILEGLYSRNHALHPQMRRTPILVVNHDNVGMNGCLEYAKKKLLDN